MNQASSSSSSEVDASDSSKKKVHRELSHYEENNDYSNYRATQWYCSIIVIIM